LFAVHGKGEVVPVLN